MYVIYPIELATLTGPKDTLTYRIDRDKRVTFPVLAFLLVPDDTDGPTVLVDTGIKAADSAFFEDFFGDVGPPGGGPDPLVEGLANRGVAPSDVDEVVLTHLHHDHASNTALFPDATFYVQAAERDAAADPPAVLADSYAESNLRALEELDVRTVDGDHVLHEGIELLLTPGHTPGSQSVVVETADGPYVLISDLAYTRHNLEPGLTSIVDATGETVETTPLDYDYVPPGILTSVVDCYDSVARVRERVGDECALLSSHEAGLAERYPAFE